MSGFSAVPEADFTADPMSTCGLGDTVTLTDNSSGLPASWLWQITPTTYNFVGTSTDTAQNPQVVFTATGSYTVTLTATNAYGSDDTTQYQLINVGGATLPFVEDFETGYLGWEIINPDGGITWESSAVSGSSPGSTAMKVAHYSYSTTGAIDELVSPPLDFTNDTLVSMSFEYASAYYSTAYNDSLKIYVSSDCGTTWSNVASYDGTESTFSTAGQTTSSFTPIDSTTWCHGNSTVVCPTIDLDAYSGMAGISVKFVTINGYGNNLYLDNINITGQAQVAPVASFQGDSAACTGQVLNFLDFSTPAPANRMWYFQGGTPPTSTSPSPAVTYASPGNYDVKLVVSNAAGQDSLTKSSFVTVTTAPIADVVLVLVSSTVCKNDSVFASATITNGGLAPSIDWIVNGTVVASNNLAFASVFTDGDVLKVRMTSSDNCVAVKTAADSVTMTVNNLPAVTLSSQGYLCELDGPMQLSGGMPAGGIYSGLGISNDTIYPSLSGVGSHWVYYTYTEPTTGCANEKKRAISIQPAPGQPTLTQNTISGELEASTPSGTYSYQWLDGNMDPISGATNSTFLPTSNGNYYVKITSNILCSNTSAAYTVVNIGLNEENLSGFEMYPNPATDRLTFNVQGSAEVRILDAAGRLVYTGFVEGKYSLDVQDWARGVYMVQVLRAGKTTGTPVVLK